METAAGCEIGTRVSDGGNSNVNDLALVSCLTASSCFSFVDFEQIIPTV